MTLLQVAKLQGIRDIVPIKARAKFAKALMIEDEAGHTTAECDALLQEAIALID